MDVLTIHQKDYNKTRITVMQGYVQVYTGDGKGKTTAALGLALRAAGAGFKVFIGQFIKSMEYNEIKALRRFEDQITLRQFGRGCFIRGNPCQEDIDVAGQAIDAVRDALISEAYDVVIADEANVAVQCRLISENDLLDLIEARPEGVELVLTGRGAPAQVIERADLVTEMKAVKHYYDKGIMAREGIER
jgi:cob(I)alamin adenosyltransferase